PRRDPSARSAAAGAAHPLGGNALADGAVSYYGTGHRKSATAKVWLFPGGTGTITVNGKPLPDYVCRRTLEMLLLQPMEVTTTTGQYDVRAKRLGGGIAGQPDTRR